MFLEKHSRFFRRYRFTIRPRAKSAPALPLVAAPTEYSVKDALEKAIRNKKAEAVQPNGDRVEIVATQHDQAKGLLTLLLHRTSPTAADPSYRKRVKDKIQVRHGTKDQDEDQAVSAHLTIRTKASAPFTYDFVLEEIPGLSMSVIRPIFGILLRDYEFPYLDKKGEEQATYSTVRADGVKSEGLDSALKKKSSLSYITLVRTNIPDAPDSDGLAEPQTEKIKYKIVGDINTKDRREKLNNFITRARKADWDDIYIEINLDDDRHRTVKLDREEEASEILFVRSEQVAVSVELKPCSHDVLDEIVSCCEKILSKP